MSGTYSLEDMAGDHSIYDDVTLPPITLTYLPTGQQITTKSEIPVGQALKVFDPEINAIAALVNNEILSLNEKLDISSTIEPIFFKGEYARQIFCDSFTVALQAAATKLFRGQALECCYIMQNARFFKFTDMALTRDDLDALKALLIDISDADLKISRTTVSFNDALHYLKEIHHKGSCNLLTSINTSKVSMARIYSKELSIDFRTLWISTLAPSTGVLGKNLWTMKLHDAGILVHLTDDFVNVKPPNAKLESQLAPIMMAYKNWSSVLRVPNVAALNELIPNRTRIREFINTCEFRHEKHISEVAKSIPDDVRCIFVAGPSSSSKTTFSNRLSVHLRTRNFQPIRVSLDDYYMNPDNIPRLENDPTKPDFEHIEALDLKRLSENLHGLLNGEEVTMAHYDFRTKTAGDGKKLKLPSGGVLIIEGIHALNDRITSAVPADKRCRIFIQPVGNLIWDELRLFESVDTRLLRRMCRDFVFRNRSADGTLDFWPSVRAGEERWILSNQSKCEIYFNSSVLYELFTLKVFAIPLLKSVPQSSRNFPSARRLLRLLEPFLPIPVELTPEISLSREFLPSGSIFEDFFF